MAQLQCFKTLWGCNGTAVEVVNQALYEGFDGIEGPLPQTKAEVSDFISALRQAELNYIAEIATTGSFVPDRRLSINDHLQSLRQQLTQLIDVPAALVSCLGGCDAWPLTQSVEFFHRAMELASAFERTISFETHRGRSLFNPWITRDILAQIPELRLTFDISHWAVVCEGLQPSEEALIKTLAHHCQHLHARVGYDQGPQVPDPRQGVYQQNFAQHLHIWRQLWVQQVQCGQGVITVTPEFGPDGYQYRNVQGTENLVNLDEINRFMMTALRQQFQQLFFTETNAKSA